MAHAVSPLLSPRSLAGRAARVGGALGLLLAAVLSVGGVACTRVNPDYMHEDIGCTPACRSGERCVRGRCISDLIATDDGGVVPPSDGPVEDAVRMPDQRRGRDMPMVADAPVAIDQPSGADVPPTPICAPDQPVCVDETHTGRCDPSGLSIVDVVACNPGDVCNPASGQCEGGGPPPACQPGESMCSGQRSVDRCAPDGSGFYTVHCPDGFPCSNAGGPDNCYHERGCSPVGGYGCFGDYIIHCVDTTLIEIAEDCARLNGQCLQIANNPATCCASPTGPAYCCTDGQGCVSTTIP